MTLLTQAQLEERMMGIGAARAKASMADAEARGESARNPYAATLFREFVEPLKVIIERDVSATGAGQRAAHVKLLKAMDPWNVAYIAVRTLMNSLLGGSPGGKAPTSRAVGYALGKMVHTELYLEQFWMMEPDLYHTMAEELGRKRSRSVEHKIKVFKSEANRQGMEFVEWPIGAREQVGMYLLDCLIALGMADMQAPPKGPGKRQELLISPSDQVLEVVQHIKSYVELTRPMYGPCVEPPMDWVAFNDGGFHTSKMRRAHPFAVKASSEARERLQGHEMPVLYAAINHLQKTAWRVNTRVLDAVVAASEFMNTGEILTYREDSKPPRPAWLAYHEKGEEMTAPQQAEFLAWKGATAHWHTKQKLDSARFRRFYSATRAAEFHREYPTLHFVWFADSRGRLYPLAQGISPQGSDLQKALLMFAQGKPLVDANAVKWFLINGANKAGFDKAALKDREAWHLEHRELILACAENPLDNLFWTTVDNPCQFLAWCFEYAEWSKNPTGFVSYLPVSLDGSCNGLQHYSAMLRDEVGGRAVNLTKNVVMSDIYAEVASVATRRMQESQDKDDADCRAKWLQHGLGRKLTKRSVMTTPYGVTKRSAVKYIIEDYLVGGSAPCFSRDTYYMAANVAMEYIWPSIGDVVIKAREAMDWLRKAGKQLGKDGATVVYWTSASGFLASQSYYDLEEHNIRTKLFGHARIKIVTESPDSSPERHATALAPNFVHSCDASHLHITTVAMANRGVTDIAMIHDDYGTHAADTELLYQTIRDTFYGIYTSFDPLASFASENGISAKLPKPGKLDLSEVLESDFFFS